MKLENQVINLDLAKRLKELGVKQDSFFYWHVWHDTNRLGISDDTTISGEIPYSAFTVAELGEMLPSRLNPKSASGETSYIQITNNGDLWLIAYAVCDNLLPHIAIIKEKMTDAFASMLIYLIENKLMEVPISS